MNGAMMDESRRRKLLTDMGISKFGKGREERIGVREPERKGEN